MGLWRVGTGWGPKGRRCCLGEVLRLLTNPSPRCAPLLLATPNTDSERLRAAEAAVAAALAAAEARRPPVAGGALDACRCARFYSAAPAAAPAFRFRLPAMRPCTAPRALAS